MNFPETHINASEERLKEFAEAIQRDFRDVGTASLLKEEEKVQSGTTILALLSPDEKVGVIMSDGRVTILPSTIYADNFKKIFSCRIGFIGAAGALEIIQKVTPFFTGDIDDICDSRGSTMRASGATRRLFQYVSASKGLVGFLALFWDNIDAKCYLSAVQFGAYVRRHRFESIGSGSARILPILNREFHARALPQSPEGLIELGTDLFKEVRIGDTATGANLYCGVINNGTFSFKEAMQS